MAEFLLEVGCEEIPAGWLAPIARQFGEAFRLHSAQQRIMPKLLRGPAGPVETVAAPPVSVVFAPRRLVLSASLFEQQEAEMSQIWGPALKIAKDGSGNWTKAAEGFAKKCGVPVAQLKVGVKAGTEQNLLFERNEAALPAADVLPSVIAASLRAINFPKRMNWDAWLEDGKGAFFFGRPIRWMVALLDGKVVPFTIYEMKNGAKADPIVKSGNVTRGHRFLPRGRAGQPIPVSSRADLLSGLEKSAVLADPDARAARITAALAPYVDRGEVHDDHGLPAEWRDLVEHPSVLVGRIAAEFRSLPVAVLETVLVHHQKYIPLLSEGVVARFAAVVNGDGASGPEIVRGMERVVAARLRDACFFFEEDRKRPLADRVEALSGVTFHRELGSYLQKAERMVRLVDAMGGTRGLLRKTEQDAAREAARLAKADLTTLMVREFPELQGQMGGIYLRAAGQASEAVAAAVQWHYQPTSIEEGSAPDLAAVGDPTVFGAVSIADKIDTLAGYFALGQIPTGSSDPFGLRRAAQGIIRVLLDFWKADTIERRPSLHRLVRTALAGYDDLLQAKRDSGVADGELRAKRDSLPRSERGGPQGGGTTQGPPLTSDDLAKELESFLVERLRYVLVARGFPGDEVEAVLGAREPDALENPHEAWVRLKALHRVRQEAREDFEHLAVAFKRAKNILTDQAAVVLDPALFQEAAERELHEAVERLRSGNGDYEARLRALAGLRSPVDRFFQDVLVMTEDERIRNNRLGLLSQALSLFYRIADISKLGG